MHTENYQIALYLTLAGLSGTLCASDSAPKRQQQLPLPQLQPTLKLTCLIVTGEPGRRYEPNLRASGMYDAQAPYNNNNLEHPGQQNLSCSLLGLPSGTTSWPVESSWKFAEFISHCIDMGPNTYNPDDPIRNIFWHSKGPCNFCLSVPPTIYCHKNRLQVDPAVQGSYRKFLEILNKLGLQPDGTPKPGTLIPPVAYLLYALTEACLHKSAAALPNPVPVEMLAAHLLQPTLFSNLQNISRLHQLLHNNPPTREQIAAYPSHISACVQRLPPGFVATFYGIIPSGRYIFFPPWNTTSSGDEAGPSGVHH